MGLYDLPIEIRRKVYSELLTQNEPVMMSTGPGISDPPLRRVGGRHRLYPAILRVDRAANREAAPFLYSDNRFQFPNSHALLGVPAKSPRRGTVIPNIIPFLQQIGDNTRLVTHVCVEFPVVWRAGRGDEPLMIDRNARVVRYIREACPSLRTLEMSSMWYDSVLKYCRAELFGRMAMAMEEAGLSAMPSLETIVLACEGWEMDGSFMVGRERLIQVVPSCKWCIKLVEPPRYRIM